MPRTPVRCLTYSLPAFCAAAARRLTRPCGSLRSGGASLNPLSITHCPPLAVSMHSICTPCAIACAVVNRQCTQSCALACCSKK
eukprot:8520-Heterococcus_DN1.PRE.1